MACSALKPNLKDCKNWSCLDSNYCHAHKDMTQEIHTQRWVKRHLLGGDGFSSFSFWSPSKEAKILSDLRNGVVRLTKKDVLSIPNNDRHLDAYVLLVMNGVASPLDNTSLFVRSLHYFCSTRIVMQELHNFARPNHTPRLLGIIKTSVIESSDKTLREFLMFAPIFARSLESKTRFLIDFIPSLLDSRAAKELSWWSHEALDKIRIYYEKVVGADHALTRCLVSRWLLDLKELYATEKAIQKIQMNQCKEELMQNRWHPDRLIHYYEHHGIESDDM